MRLERCCPWWPPKSRALFPSVYYPVNYGLVPGSKAGDGDCLDIMVLSEEPILRGTLVTVRPVAVLLMSDQKGKDEKVLAVPQDDPHYDHVAGHANLPGNRLQEIELFFRLYRLPEDDDEVKLDGWGSSDRAWRLVNEAPVMEPEDEIFRSGSRRPAG